MTSLAKQSDLVSVVRLHQKVLPHTLNSQIGFDYLLSLYRQILNGSGNRLLIEKKGRLVSGFICVTRDLQSVNDSVTHEPTLIKKIVLYLLQHPYKVLYLFNRIKFSRNLKSYIPGVKPWILTLGVDRRYRHQGLASKLVRKAFRYLRSEKIGIIYTDTEVTNTVADSFYRTLGFKKICELNDNLVYKKNL